VQATIEYPAPSDADYQRITLRSQAVADKFAARITQQQPEILVITRQISAGHYILKLRAAS
jgi:hypothetical protein